MARTLVLLITVALLLALFTAFYVQSLRSVEVEESSITSLAAINEEGFTLAGTLTLRNTGWLSVKFDRAEYEIILQGNGARLASGTVTGFALPPDKPVDVNFVARVSWHEVASASYELLRARQGEVVVRGKVVISEDFKAVVPFEQTLDISSLLKNLFEEQTPTLMTRIEGVIGKAFGAVD